MWGGGAQQGPGEKLSSHRGRGGLGKHTAGDWSVEREKGVPEGSQQHEGGMHCAAARPYSSRIAIAGRDMSSPHHTHPSSVAVLMQPCTGPPTHTHTHTVPCPRA